MQMQSDHALAGLCAGLASTILLYPLDLIKVRFQVHDGTGGAYQNVWRSFWEIKRNEGFRGLYSGVIPAVLANSLSWGGYFYFYENSKRRKQHALVKSSSGRRSLGTTDHLLASTEAGMIMVAFTNPLWLIKTRLQIQGGDTNVRQYKGLSDAIMRITKEEGILGLYKGAGPALLLTSHGAVQFAVYEHLKKITDSDKGPKAWVSVMTGITSKLIATVVTYPYQVIKSRLQRQKSHDNSKTYRGMWDATTRILRYEGIRGFFKGLSANCLRVAPSAGITFLVYEETVKLLKVLH
jgi:solute carrier family 25 (mitochondrial folate transporter), member 32